MGGKSCDSGQLAWALPAYLRSAASALGQLALSGVSGIPVLEQSETPCGRRAFKAPGSFTQQGCAAKQ